MLAVQNLTVRRGANILLQDSTFQINPGEKVGLVGVNGAGKSSLLKTLYGELDAEAGVISRPEGVGYLAQERMADAQLVVVSATGEFGADVTIRDFMFAARGLGQLTADLHHIEKELESATTPAEGTPTTDDPLNDLLARYGELEEQYLQAGGYEAENEIAQLLRGLGMTNIELDRPMDALSGGQKTKVALARVLFAAPTLLMLDEPTNHLDGKATRWLMEYLARYEGSVILISHDMTLLDHAITRVLHLESSSRSLVHYTGNYSSYLRQRKQSEEKAVVDLERKTEKMTQLADQANWIRGKTEKMARRAKVLDKVIEKMKDDLPDASSLPKRERAFTMDLPVTRMSGQRVLTATALSKTYGENHVLKNLSFEIERGQRLVVIGQNGAGKTTLLRCLAERLTPTSGSIKFGHNVDMGYYAQEHELLHPEMTLLEELAQAAEDAPYRVGPLPGEKHLRSILGRFLFSGQQVFQKVATLSGGEKTRLALARLMLGGYNTLLLDEPTNNLDTVSRQRVLAALAGYRGTLLVVSHDTEFVAALDPEYAILLPAGQVRYFDPEMLSLVAKT